MERLRRHLAAGSMIVIGLFAIVAFGLGSRTGHGAKAAFGFDYLGKSSIHLPDLTVPAGPAAIGLGALCVTFGVLRLARPALQTWAIAGFLACLVAAFLTWGTAGQSLAFTGLLNATLLAAVPLVLGSLCGLLCERSGIINVAIEGQFLVGACASAYVGSVSGSLWAGLIAGCLAGALLGALLAVFANRYLVGQVVLGVVLNVFAAGLTGFLYERLLQADPNHRNKALTFADIRIPGLASLPVVGPVLFDQNIIFYLAVLLIAAVQIGLFHTRWGLRTRAVGEHPTAAETVGIRVLATRYRNVIMAGLISGLGGVWMTLGSGAPFGKDMAAGQGFIALAALIFGRWSPLGSLSAALLFGFAQGISISLQPLNTPVPTAFLSMTPYLATIFAVAGLVGHVRAPAAEGIPYVKA
ncbi:MAG: inner-rane translocator [Actinomycetia bacterium]|nr:inner-rane translocator [Actinomycetes bacterium]